MKQCNGNGCKTWIDVRMPGSGPGETGHTIIHIMIYVRNDFVMECSFFGTCRLEHLHVCILYNLFITLFADISQNVAGALLCFSMDSYTLLPKKGLSTDSKRWLFKMASEDVKSTNVFFTCTLPETNIAPENRPFQTEI